MPKRSGRTLGERLLRPIEVQALLGIGATTLWNYSKAGVLKPVQRTAGGHGRYREADVLALKARLVEAVAFISPATKITSSERPDARTGKAEVA